MRFNGPHPGSAGTHDYGDQAHIAAFGGRSKVESRGADESGLDAIDPGADAEEAVGIMVSSLAIGV